MTSFGQLPGVESTNARRLSIWLLTTFTFLLLLFVPYTSHAELASQPEMNRVCENWVIEMQTRHNIWTQPGQGDVAQVTDLYAGDTLIAKCYSINGGGFVLVPTLKEMMPVKAYSATSELNEEQEGGFLLMLQEVLSERFALYAREFGSLEAAQTSKGAPMFDPAQRAAWDVYTLDESNFRAQLATSKDVQEQGGPLTETSWHQSGPYYDDCPMGDGGRTVVGCVATAFSQILAYWQWPPYGKGSYSYTWDGDQSCDGNTSPQVLSADFSDTYDWANIADSCDGGCTSAQEAALAELCYEAGVALDMDYGNCGSGAYTGQAAVAFPSYFRYQKTAYIEYRDQYATQQEYYDIAKNEIDAGRVIQYRINLHSIVLDGYRDDGGILQFHMNYGWGNSFNAWYVIDELYCSWISGDVCPYDEEFMVVGIEPQDFPEVVMSGYSVVDNGEDGLVSPGESATVSVTLRNDGWHAGDVVAHLSSSDVTITQSDVSAGAMQADDEMTPGTTFEFTAPSGMANPSIVEIQVQVVADDVYETTQTIYLFVGDQPGFADACDSDTAFWAHYNNSTGYVDQWHIETARSHSNGECWKMGGSGTSDYTNSLDAALVTPPFLLPVNGQLSFWHWLSAELGDPGTAWDGAIIMISTDGGPWEKLTPDGGYTHTIVENPASPFESGEPCLAISDGWEEVTVDLTGYSGIAQIMFRFGSDGAAVEEGWYVDDVQVTSSGCCIGMRGNVDCSDGDGVDIGDLTDMINYLFIDFHTLCCVDEADLTVPPDGVVDIGDLNQLINYLFITFAPLNFCD